MKKPHIIALAAISLLVISVCAVLAVKPATQAVQQPQIVVFTPQALLVEANRLRAAKGVAPLRLDERLNETAQVRADDMAKRNYFSHYDPVTGENLAKILNKYWPEPCQGVSENLDGAYYGQSPFAGEGWVSSKPHYEAEIDPKYDITGFGSVITDGQVYYVQHFCDLR